MHPARQLLIAALRWASGVLVAGLLAALLLYAAPGATVDEREIDPALGERTRARLRAEAGARPDFVSYYAGFLQSALRGDLGTSRAYHLPVTQLIGERWSLTAAAVAEGLAAAWALGLAGALLSAGSRWASPPFTAFSVLLLCLPSGLLAIAFFLARLPVAGILAAAVFPKIYQYLRNLLDQAARAPHCLAARARGIGPLRLLLLHRAWPLWPEAVTLAGVTVSTAIGAAIPTEALCDVPGLGQLAWKSALARDLPLLVALTIAVAAVTLGVNSVASVAAAAGGGRRWRS
ncbi:MAG: ABC transporter permease subunit [Candidatus Solibacter usitatus]|nr:ABC transporter permease subunit [Candidatus Solibacter usitatus]